MISIPAAPLPRIKTLFKAFFSPYNFNNLRSCDKSSFLYSRGMWGLASGIKALLNKKGKKEGVVWFPDYFCNEPLSSIRQLPVKMHFYSISKNVEPKWDTLEKRANKLGSADIFVLVHYFGFPNNLKRAREFCEEYKIELIEDAAHVLLPTCGIGESGSAVIYSPRKVLALPEGGMLVAHKELQNYIRRPDNVFVNKMIIIWFVKRFVQKIMVELNVPWHKFWKVKASEYSNAKELNSLPSPNYSLIAFKLLGAMEGEFEKIIQRRRENYDLLSKKLVNKNMRPLFSSLPEFVCPYAFPALVEKDRNLILQKLQGNGIPASSWPNLPPEILEHRETHREAIWLQRHIILFPVHQSLSKAQMQYIIEASKDVLRSVTSDNR